MKGFGLALQRKILAGIEAKQDLQSARHLHRAEELLTSAKASLQKSELGLKNIQTAGDFRRGSELVSDLALVAEQTGAKTSRLKFGDLSVHVATGKRLGAALLFATGSDAHLEQLQKLAAKKGFELAPDGLYRDGKLLASRTEQEIYQALGLDFIEPELREGRGEIASFATQAVAARSSKAAISLAFCTRTPQLPMVSTVSNRWQKQRESVATPILA